MPYDDEKKFSGPNPREEISYPWKRWEGADLMSILEKTVWP